MAQKDEDGKEGVIAYASKTIVGAQERYTATELELLAVKWATDQFHVYLLGKPFTIITDHISLRPQFSNLKLNNRMQKWLMHLQQYTFTIEYNPGRAQKHVDLLSRPPSL